MKFLDSIIVNHENETKTIELYHGDLTDMPPEHAVDVLIISSFPNNYYPTRGTVIRALDQKGISVKELFGNKAVDLRESFSSWLSQPIESDDPRIQFKQVMCFESVVGESSPEIVRDVFQGLMPLVTGNDPITSIAMSMIGTGGQGAKITDVLEQLIDMAVHWLALGIPVKTIKLVEYSQLKAWEMKGAFAILKKRYADLSLIRDSSYTHDLFISYSHNNTQDVEFFVEQIRKLDPNIRLFYDRQNLDSGAAWQHEIYEALDDCKKVITFYSPDYLQSKVCKEEYNIALFRHRDAKDGILIPIHLYSAELPSYMKLVQYIDCREANHEKLIHACEIILQQL